jgi:hypothetical protein
LSIDRVTADSHGWNRRSVRNDLDWLYVLNGGVIVRGVVVVGRFGEALKIISCQFNYFFNLNFLIKVALTQKKSARFVARQHFGLASMPIFKSLIGSCNRSHVASPKCRTTTKYFFM